MSRAGRHNFFYFGGEVPRASSEMEVLLNTNAEQTLWQLCEQKMPLVDLF